MAKLRVGLNELRVELEAAVARQDFPRAKLIKDRIDAMEEKMAR